MTTSLASPDPAALQQLALRVRPGQHVSLGQSIMFTIDRAGRFRFQYRWRIGGPHSRQCAATFDTYEDALAERQRVRRERTPTRRSTRFSPARLPLEHYVAELWWPDVLRTTEPLTQIWYRSAWENDIGPFFSGLTLQQLCERRTFADWDQWLRVRKVHRRGARVGAPADGAIDKAYNILFRILQHAVDEGHIERNPFERAKRKRRKERRLANKQASDELRPITAAEVPTVLEVELLRFHLRGRTLRELAIKRALIDLLAYEGLRPGEALYLRHRHHRTAICPRLDLIVEGAVKDLGSVLTTGGTKTGRTRTSFIFNSVRDSLDQLFKASGSDLDTLVLPNVHGGYLRWDNFRTNSFYPALHRAGLAKTRSALSPGSFVPYRLRHLSVTLQFHARKADGSRYDHPEIAYHHGNTIGVLLSRYTHVYRRDLHEAAGRTVDEIIHSARRAVWGPLPGDDDFVDERLSLLVAARETGLSAKALAARIARGTLPSRDGSIRRFDLLSLGLLPPAIAKDHV